jgi:hypothetical protein
MVKKTQCFQGLNYRDDRFRVLVDHGAAVWAPAKPHFDLSRLHHRRGFPVKGSEIGQGRLGVGGMVQASEAFRMSTCCELINRNYEMRHDLS